MSDPVFMAAIEAIKERHMNVCEPVKGPVCTDKSCWMRHRHEEVRPIELEQIISLSAMVSYVSKMTGRSEYGVERDFADHFCVPNLKCLPFELYDRALDYISAQIPPSRS